MGVLKVAPAAVLAMAMAIATAAAAEKNVSPLTGELRSALNAAEAVAARGDPATSAMAFEAVASHADFARLDGPRRAAILLRAAQLAIDAGEPARAHRLAEASVHASDGDPDAWYVFAQLSANQGRDEDAAAAFARLARGWPELVQHLAPESVNPVVHGLDVGSPARLELLEALFAADWTAHGIPVDHAWAQLALMRADRGDAQGARVALAGITEPGIIAWMRSDRRFDRLFDRKDPRFDPALASEAWITRVRATAAASPATLPPLRELGYALLRSGHAGEALAVADQALADPGRFDDTDDLHWMQHVRAVALRRQGRTDEALAALTEAAAMDESGEPNVSQTLNLGTLLADMERPLDALAAVARVKDMSPYGEMVQSTTRLRAHRQLGQADDAAVWFDRIRANRDESPGHYLEALLWTGRDDEAADWLVSMLADADQRVDALDWCANLRRSEPLPGRLALVEARRALLARPQVRDAIAAVGRIEDTGLYSIGIN
ncbi:hypothetical protein ACW5F0_02250 [Luteimonas sp. A534]